MFDVPNALFINSEHFISVPKAEPICLPFLAMMPLKENKSKVLINPVKKMTREINKT